MQACSEKLYLIGGIATPGESRAQAGEEVITLDTSLWNCARRITTGAGPEFTDSHAAVTAGMSHSTADASSFSINKCGPHHFLCGGTGQRLYTFGGTDGGHKFNEVGLMSSKHHTYYSNLDWFCVPCSYMSWT